MTYIFQPERFLLVEQIKTFSHYIKGDVLDVGAGHYDRYKKFFSVGVSKYIKMDIAHRENVDLVGSADSIPLPDASVDSIVCTQVLEHVKYPEKCIREAYRVLKTGGFALYTAPQMNELHEIPYDFFRYTKYGLISMFEESGFKIIECSQRGGFFSTLTQMIIRYTTDKLNLYSSKVLGKIFGKFAWLLGKLAIWLDKRDTSRANHVHAIGWCIVVKKI